MTGVLVATIDKQNNKRCKIPDVSELSPDARTANTHTRTNAHTTPLNFFSIQISNQAPFVDADAHSRASLASDKLLTPAICDYDSPERATQHPSVMRGAHHANAVHPAAATVPLHGAIEVLVSAADTRRLAPSVLAGPIRSDPYTT